MNKPVLTVKKSVFFIGPVFCFLLFSTASFALPFNIMPKAGFPLPIYVPVGGTVTAYYTVSNNTVSQRNGNYVKYLPPNVSQVTSGVTFGDTCGTTFNLTAKGESGSSCTLQLTVSGAVNSNDPNPHQHLFVCFPGGKTCAGTNFPLNVVQLAPLNMAYVANSGANNIIFCKVSEAAFNTLAPFTDCIASDPIFNTPLGITFNALNTLAYVVNRGNSTVSLCRVGANGALINCANTGSGFAGPGSLALNSTNTFAYVTNAAGSNRVSVCSVNAVTGNLSGCADTGPVFNDPLGIALNPASTFAYIADPVTNVFVCAVNNMTGALSGCVATGSGFTGPTSVAINSANTFAYVTNFNSTVSVCAINSSTGALSGCVPTGSGFDLPVGIAFNPAGTFIYVSNSNPAANNISACAVNNTTGALSDCVIAATGFSQPTGLALN